MVARVLEAVCVHADMEDTHILAPKAVDGRVWARVL